MTKGKSTKGKASFTADDPRLKSKRWKKCACGVNLMHIGSKRCWACAGTGNPKAIMGSANPYAAFLLRQEKAIAKGVKGTKARAKVAAVAAKQEAKTTVLANGHILSLI